jgi:hypothetical protein
MYEYDRLLTRVIALPREHNVTSFIYDLAFGWELSSGDSFQY